MGVELDNLDEQVLQMGVPGTQTATTDKEFVTCPMDGFIKAIIAKLGTAGITGTQVVDIHKNGVTVFGSLAKIVFATTNVAPNAHPAYGDISVLKGDQLSLDVDTIHSGTVAEDLTVALVISKRPRQGVVANF